MDNYEDLSSTKLEQKTEIIEQPIQKNFGKNFVLIYIWQFLSFISNFLSFFIVIPRFSLNENLYGIYSVCISVSIFLQYADLGFVTAGFKYSSEAYARNNKQEEIEIIGFISFILTLFISAIIIIILYYGFYPEKLINNLTPDDKIIASKLLYILAIFSFSTIIQKTILFLLGIRLEDYIFNKISLFANLIRIFSSFYFFTSTRYDIVGYFLFFQMIGLIPIFYCLYILKVKYNYKFKPFIKGFKFNKIIFKKTYKLAIVSFYNTLLWILFFELDQIIIGKIFDAASVSFYAIGLSIFSFFRTLMSIIFNPFNARFNHFIGIQQYDELKVYFQKIIETLGPILIIPILSVLIYIRPFILTWVGDNYEISIIIAAFLIMGYLGHFISIPTSVLIIAQEKVKLIGIIGTLQTAIYWLGIFFTLEFIGILSFAVFKFVAFTVCFIIYFIIAKNYINIKIKEFLKKNIIPGIISILFLIIFGILTIDYLPTNKNALNILIVLIFIGISSILSIGIFMIFSNSFKNNIFSMLKEIPIFKNILSRRIKDNKLIQKTKE